MKFGVFYEHQIPRPWDAGSEHRQFAQALDQIERADALGFDYAWMVEHHFLEEYSHGSSPTAFLAAASQRTSTIRLGHGIIQITSNHPIRVAEGVATLDLLSDGRVELGTGEGAGPRELHPFGVRVREKRQMWEEGIRALIPCLTQDSVEFHGKYWDWTARNVLPKPLQKPHPPLWVACSNLATIEMCARRGMGALGFQFATPEGARAWVNRYYTLLAAGPDKLCDYQVNPNIAVVSGFMCSPTDAEARSKADGWTFFVFCLQFLAENVWEPGTVNLWERYQEWKTTPGAATTFDSGLVGSPETLRAQAGRLRRHRDRPDHSPQPGGQQHPRGHHELARAVRDGGDARIPGHGGGPPGVESRRAGRKDPAGGARHRRPHDRHEGARPHRERGPRPRRRRAPGAVSH